MDQIGLLQHRHKNGRHNHAPHRILPPGQGLHAAHLSRKRADDRLIVHLDMPFLQGPVEIAKHIDPIRKMLPHGLVIHRKGPAGVPLNPVRCDFRPIKEKMNTTFADFHLIGIENIHPRLQLHRRIAGKIPDIPGHRLNPLRHIVMKSQHRKGIPGQMGDDRIGKMGSNTFSHKADKPVPRLRAVTGIVHLEIGEIEIQRRPAAEDALLHILPGLPGNCRIKSPPVHELQIPRLPFPVTDTGKTPDLPQPFILIDSRCALHRETAGGSPQLKIKRPAPFLCSAALAKGHIPLSHKSLKRAAPLRKKLLHGREAHEQEKRTVCIKHPFLIIHRHQTNPAGKPVQTLSSMQTAPILHIDHPIPRTTWLRQGTSLYPCQKTQENAFLNYSVLCNISFM